MKFKSTRDIRGRYTCARRYLGGADIIVKAASLRGSGYTRPPHSLGTADAELAAQVIAWGCGGVVASSGMAARFRQRRDYGRPRFIARQFSCDGAGCCPT